MPLQLDNRPTVELGSPGFSIIWCDMFLFLIVAVIVSGVANGSVTHGRLAIMQGATSTDVVQVIVLGTVDDQNYRFVLRDGKVERSPTVLDTVQRNGSVSRLYRLRFEGLSAGTSYRFEVYSGKQLFDRRIVRTLAKHKEQIRFVVASCMDDSIEQGDVWQQMVRLNPDVIFFIGDNSYNTYKIGKKYQPTPSDLWRRHAETRNHLKIFRSEKLYPIIAVWDDHDYGSNNGGKEYKYKDQSLAIFKSFFIGLPTDSFRLAGLGLASKATIYGVDFFLLDNRTFRTTSHNVPQFHFGDLQSRWLMANLNDKGYAFIISGDQFFGGYHRFESFQGQHEQRFMKFLEQLKGVARKVVFLSGDRHLSEAMEIPAKASLGYKDKNYKSPLNYKTYEFTSSPVHGKVYDANPWDKKPNPLHVAGRGGVHNFLSITTQQKKGFLEMKVISLGKEGKIYWQGTYGVR